MSALAGEVSFGNPMWEYLVYQYFFDKSCSFSGIWEGAFFINELRKENFIMYGQKIRKGEYEFLGINEYGSTGTLYHVAYGDRKSVV